MQESPISPLQPLKDWVKQSLIREKLNNPFGYGILVFVSLLIAFLISTQGAQTGLLIISLLLFFPALALSLFHLPFGILFITLLSFLIRAFSRYIPAFPWEFGIDLLVITLLLGMLIKKVPLPKRHDPLAKLMIGWAIYLVIGLLMHPIHATSLMHTRELLMLLGIHFIARHAFNQKVQILYWAYFFVFLSVICALYGLKQHYLGFFQHELRWIYHDPDLFNQFSSWGRIQIFSTLFSPASFGMLMASAAAFTCCLILLRKISLRVKILLCICLGVLLLALFHAHQRTAFFIFPLGFFVYTLITLRKTAILLSLILGVLGMGYLVVKPDSIIAKKTTRMILEKEDPLFSRPDQQRTLQRFVRSNPLGIGSGKSMKKPDLYVVEVGTEPFLLKSGFLRISIEQGWIGLILLMLMLGLGLQRGLIGYFSLSAETDKGLQAALLCLLFCLIAGNYTQSSLITAPTHIIFAIALAANVKVYQPPKQKKHLDSFTS